MLQILLTLRESIGTFLHVYIFGFMRSVMVFWFPKSIHHYTILKIVSIISRTSWYQLVFFLVFPSIGDLSMPIWCTWEYHFNSYVSLFSFILFVLRMPILSWIILCLIFLFGKILNDLKKINLFRHIYIYTKMNSKFCKCVLV